jgi:hypothetical protein
MAPLRARSLLVLAALVAAVLGATSARAHTTGSHTGLLSTVSYVQPQLPGLLVRVIGGHVRLSVANLTRKDVVILDARGRPLVHVAPGQTRVWTEPRIGAAQSAPDREGLIRYWRIPGKADGRRFQIVGFLGYRPPPGTTGGGTGVPTWAIVLAATAGALLLAVAVAVPLRARDET